jgi:hypothetical protein
MISSNSQMVIIPTTGPLTRLLDSTDTQHTTTITNLTSTITTGRNVGMELIELITSSYENYTANITPGLPNNDTYTVYKDNTQTTTKTIQLYPTNVRQNMIEYSIILGSIFCYSLDSIIYNCTGDIAVNSLDSYSATSLFSGILTRTGSKSTIVPFKLWNSDDFRYVTYLTYLWNMTRLYFISTNNVNFYPSYVQIKNSSTVSTQEITLGYALPNAFLLNQSVIFYHVVDPTITNFTVYQHNIGQNTQSFFNNIIASIYAIITNYTSLFFTNSSSYIHVSLDTYTNTDAYKIYSAYMKTVIGTTSTIQSQQQVSYTATTIGNIINANISYNFAQVNSIIILLKQLYWVSTHYIISFMKSFAVTSSTQLTSSTKATFIPIINSNIQNLNDNFITILNNYIPVTVNNVTMQNFFNTDVNTNFNTFINNCQNQLKSTNFDDYTDYIPLWQTLSSTSSWFTNMQNTNYQVSTNVCSFGKNTTAYTGKQSN